MYDYYTFAIFIKKCFIYFCLYLYITVRGRDRKRSRREVGSGKDQVMGIEPGSSEAQMRHMSECKL